MGTKSGIWELCMLFGVVTIVLAGVMSAAASPAGGGDDKNYESTYIKSSDNSDDADRARNILQTRDAKSNLTDAQKKLSTDLIQLLDSTFFLYGQDKETLKTQMTRLQQFRPAGSGSAPGDMVYVYIHLNSSAETRTVDPYVGEVTGRDEGNHLAVAWVEVDALETLASLGDVRAIRTVMPPIVRAGSVTTEGDAIHRTYDVRTTYAQNGSGVKVGIISDGVDYWADAQNSGDMPADLTVLSNTIGGDEGTAMLEIVYDMVPDADLYFHDCGDNIVAFDDAIDALVGAGCDVVCDDIGWYEEPFFEDGVVASHLTSVLASNDIVYVSAAGNDGDGHYQGDYYDDGYSYHDFSRGDETDDKYIYVEMPNNSDLVVVLQWNDEFGSSGNDYDLYLYKCPEYGDPLAGSIYVQDGDDDPIEAFVYTNNEGSTITAEIDIMNYLAETKTLEVFIYPCNGAYVYTNNIDPADSIYGHPAVPGVIAVGAIDASDPGNDDIEPSTSQGPVTITYPSEVSRAKPDLCGIDGVTTTGAGSFPVPFYGTSAAAPHIAAIAAQMEGAFPDKTGDEIRTLLCDSAVDTGAAGYDNIYGYGRADALNAVEGHGVGTGAGANWTFMVYMDGDNNLESAAIDDMNELESVGSTSNVNIVVQFDRIGGYDTSNGDWTGTRRYYVTQDSSSTITSTLVSDLGEVNMADPAVLSGFTEWAMTDYPAENYALILWNHGSGWKYPRDDHDPLRCIIYDDTSGGDDLSIHELKESLGDITDATGETIDLLGFDACLMQMVEVSYQVVDYSDVVVSSEESEPGDGWPYDLILAALTNDPTMSATDLGSQIVMDYISSYGTTGEETQSASDQAELPGLITAIDCFAGALSGCLSSNYSDIMDARNRSESYAYPEYIDLYDFAEEVSLSVSNTTVESAAIDVMDNISNTIFAEAHGIGHPDSHGFSIYFPTERSGYDSTYESIDFAVDTRWDEFLNEYYIHGCSTIVPGAEILLVDDDLGYDYDAYYKNALDANGYIYSYWDVDMGGSPDLATMSLHPVIIWYTGESWSTTLTSADQSTIANYLDAGGNLFVSGQDIGYNIGDTTFYNDYLHSDYIEDNTGIHTLTGISLDPISDGLTIEISGGDGAEYMDYYPSDIAPHDADASMVFNYTGDGCGAIKADTGTYRLVYFAFGFETINSEPDRNIVMDRVITWLMPSGHVTGDLDGDGCVTPADAAIALQIAASGVYDDAADINDDGYVTSLDALLILQASTDGITV